MKINQPIVDHGYTCHMCVCVRMVNSTSHRHVRTTIRYQTHLSEHSQHAGMCVIAHLDFSKIDENHLSPSRPWVYMCVCVCMVKTTSRTHTRTTIRHRTHPSEHSQHVCALQRLLTFGKMMESTLSLVDPWVDVGVRMVKSTSRTHICTTICH
jgi:hypothetical protein